MGDQRRARLVFLDPDPVRIKSEAGPKEADWGNFMS